jgi:ATP-dependent Clp protease ATP-binding subunit ClpC
MFERYTEKARRVVFFARYEASQLRASQIEPEHILLGILREDQLIANRFFPEGSRSVGLIRSYIENRVVNRSSVADANVDLPLSSEAKRVLSFAAQEADTFHIGNEHLLLGILLEEGTIAYKVLTELGVVLEDVRKIIKENKLKDRRADSRYIFGEEFKTTEVQPAEISQLDEKWVQEVLKSTLDRGLITTDELASEFERVAGLREFPVDVEALLRLLAAKGLADPHRLITLALELRNQEKLEEFIKKINRE